MGASTKNTGLGRDFSSLIPDDMLSEALSVGSNVDSVERLTIDIIEPDPKQPRKHFDSAALNELAQSIKVHGVVQPLIVAKNGPKYLIIAGERRYRASKLAKLTELPVIIRSYGEQEKLEISLIENVQREDLTALDLAAAYLKLHNEFNLSYEQVASKVGKSTPTVHNTVRLLKLPLEAKKALHAGLVSEGHARQVIALTSETEQLKLLNLIIKNGWTVRQAEQYVVGKKQESKHEKPKALARTKSETNETKQLAIRLKTPVSVKHMAKGGQLVIRFSDEAHLQKLIDELLS